MSLSIQIEEMKKIINGEDFNLSNLCEYFWDA